MMIQEVENRLSNGVRLGQRYEDGILVQSAPNSKNTTLVPKTTVKDRLPIALYLEQDDVTLSSYQSLLRQQIELFQASSDDAQANAKGRNKPVTIGQVGIRCRHCNCIPVKKRVRGAVYYPSKLHLIYQCAQIMAKSHINGYCKSIPLSLLQELKEHQLQDKSPNGGGKVYWAEGVRIHRVVETDQGLRFQGAA